MTRKYLCFVDYIFSPLGEVETTRKST